MTDGSCLTHPLFSSHFSPFESNVVTSCWVPPRHQSRALAKICYLDYIIWTRAFINDRVFLNVNPQWIKAHQDHKEEKEKLAIEAQLNCRADQLAGSLQLQRPPQDINQVHPCPYVPTQVSLCHGTITSHHIGEIRQHITSAPLTQYFNMELTEANKSNDKRVYVKL